MPSLVPKQIYERVQIVRGILGLFENADALFRSDRARPTIERVAKYLAHVYENFADGSFERVSRANTVTEQFFLFMPTQAAYLAEMTLIEAIAAHSHQRITDAALRRSLEQFIDTHIFVYSGFSRTLKTGDWKKWAKTPLVICEWPTNTAGPCNFIQAWLWFLIEKRTKTDIEFNWSVL